MTATTARVVAFDVIGIPHPQGSMRAMMTPKGKGVHLQYPPGVIDWRQRVQQAACDTGEETLVGPLELRLGFDLPRPLNHFWPINSRHNGEVREDAPPYPTGAPDLDKLIRAICDAITDSRLWQDDSQVVSTVAAKRYCPPIIGTPFGGKPAGVHVQITELL
jgi:crossover junction endodeoxyribonuclease RusA